MSGPQPVEPPAILVGTVRDWARSNGFDPASARWSLDDEDAVRVAKPKPGDRVWSCVLRGMGVSIEACAVQPAEGTQLVWPNDMTAMLDRQLRRFRRLFD